MKNDGVGHLLNDYGNWQQTESLRLIVQLIIVSIIARFIKTISNLKIVHLILM